MTEKERDDLVKVNEERRQSCGCLFGIIGGVVGAIVFFLAVHQAYVVGNEFGAAVSGVIIVGGIGFGIGYFLANIFYPDPP